VFHGPLAESVESAKTNMATFAAVKRETKSWKWPLIQMGYMGFMAYTLALLTFNLFS
jgi:ferrous iron transport protein B